MVLPSQPPDERGNLRVAAHRVSEPPACGVGGKVVLRAPRADRRAFTLIELILVMAILTMAVAVTAPVLSTFFRGRTLDSEARRMLALTHLGQNRAVAEGVPMDLWFDGASGKFGLEAERSYETADAHAVEYDIDGGLKLEVGAAAAPTLTSLSLARMQPVSTASVRKVTLSHPGLPTIRFLPDGTLGENSPQKLRLTARDGSSLWLVQATDRLSYEIRKTDE